MIFRVGDGPLMMKVQHPTYSVDVVITEEMGRTVQAMIDRAVLAEKEKIDGVQEDLQV